jgi:isopentenyl-diphosphate delta-isomerase
MDETLILVDESDNRAGYATKSEVHELGLLHRAFSIFIFNTRGNLLLQRRALTKYHSAGLWTNTCCGHPVKGEEVKNAAYRRLKEEMSMVADIEEICTFRYRAKLENGLIENELDHIYCGVSDILPDPNPKEVAEWKFASSNELIQDLSKNPASYTAWFKLILEKNLLGDLIRRAE